VATPATLGERVAGAIRRDAGRRLGAEAKRLRAAGTAVILIQPTAEDLDAMGGNLMSRGRRNLVIGTAVQTMTDQLSGSTLGERLRRLPRGLPALVRRPPGAASSWPDFRELAAARRAPSAPSAPRAAAAAAAGARAQR